MSDAQITQLVDRQAVVDVFNRYATGIDTRDTELYRSCFTDDLGLDMWGGNGPTQSTGDAWVEQAFNSVSSFQVTQHVITNHVIEVDGDRATGIAYLLAQHWNPENFMLVGGYYKNDFIRDGETWRIEYLRLNVTWHQTG
jgi:hypothetical protein